MRAGNTVASTQRLRLLLKALTGCSVLALAAVFAGPISSGAVLLLLPAPQRAVEHDLPTDYTPLHKGHVSLNVGLYTRENEDLVVPGTPALVLRRTYISGFRAAKEFGIGTTQAGEWYLVGDGKTFQWAALIRPGEYRVRFERTSSGTSLLNAMYTHRSSADEWQDAHLGWTGVGWALRQADGSLAQFRPCGPDAKDVCSIMRYRDADGHVINYRRTAAGRLERMEAGPNRWIAFDYDDGNRVIRAFDSTKHEVRYEYDERGRWRESSQAGRSRIATRIPTATRWRRSSSRGRTSRTSTTRTVAASRQVNRYADGSDPYVFDFTYTLDGSDVVKTDTRRSDGTWTQYTFSKAGFTTSETWGREKSEPASFIYERDPVTNAVVSLNLSCPDRTGRQLRHSSLVKPGREEWIKWDLVRTHCSLTGGTGAALAHRWLRPIGSGAVGRFARRRIELERRRKWVSDAGCQKSTATSMITLVCEL